MVRVKVLCTTALDSFTATADPTNASEVAAYNAAILEHQDENPTHELAYRTLD